MNNSFSRSLMQLELCLRRNSIFTRLVKRIKFPQSDSNIKFRTNKMQMSHKGSSQVLPGREGLRAAMFSLGRAWRWVPWWINTSIIIKRKKLSSSLQGFTLESPTLLSLWTGYSSSWRAITERPRYSDLTIYSKLYPCLILMESSMETIGVPC